MPKKNSLSNVDSARLVKRLRDAQVQLRSQSTRAARAADALAEVLQAVEAQIGAARSDAAAQPVAATKSAARTSRAGTARKGSRTPRPAHARPGLRGPRTIAKRNGATP
jgi:hypothetical protein